MIWKEIKTVTILTPLWEFITIKFIYGEKLSRNILDIPEAVNAIKHDNKWTSSIFMNYKISIIFKDISSIDARFFWYLIFLTFHLDTLNLKEYQSLITSIYHRKFSKVQNLRNS